MTRRARGSGIILLAGVVAALVIKAGKGAIGFTKTAHLG
jgi:hypothetical protein